jgi:oxygen-dependent protoporphyrinogen oxidase
VVVVGAGIAGLSAAWALRDRDVLVLEAAQRIGGRIKSEVRGRYWLNFGAHVFGGADSATGGLIDQTGCETMTVPGVLTAVSLNGRLLASGRVEMYPFRLPLSMADRISLIRVGVRLRLAVTRYGRILRSQPGETDAEQRLRTLAYLGDESFSDFLGRLPPEVDALFRPTIERSSGEPEDVAAGYGVGYFHLVWNRGEGLSRNILGGPSKLAQSIAPDLAGRLWTGSLVEEVIPEKEGVRVRYVTDGQPREVRARFAIVATPAFVTRTIVHGLPEETERALAEIAYGPYVVAAFLTKEAQPMRWDGIYAIATPKRSFNMLFNTANVVRARETRREPGGSLMVYAGARLGDRMLELDDERVVNAFTDDLHDLFPEARGIVEEVVVQRWARGLPYPRPGRFRIQPALERSLGAVFLAGDYLGTRYTDTAIGTGTAAAQAIRARLNQKEDSGGA